MPTGDHHLTHPERSPISALQSTGRSQRPMAEPLGRDVSPISRELRRHRGQRGDRPQPAQGKATSRRRAASAVPWKMTPERWAVAEEWLRAGWSPEPIAGRFQQPGEGMAGREWIDQSIRAETATSACGGAESSRTGVVADMQDAVTFPVGWTSPNAR